MQFVSMCPLSTGRMPSYSLVESELKFVLAPGEVARSPESR